MESKNFYWMMMGGGRGGGLWGQRGKGLGKEFVEFFGSGERVLEESQERYKEIVGGENILIRRKEDQREVVVKWVGGLRECKVIVEEEEGNRGGGIGQGWYVIEKMNGDGRMVVGGWDEVIVKMDELKGDIVKWVEFGWD